MNYNELEEAIMFRDMRRIKQHLPDEAIRKVLKEKTNGILGVNGEDGYPYAIPLNYTYLNEAIYFHCAKTGHIIDAIKNNSKVCFTVVDEDTIVSEEFTSYFRSVIAFGKASIVETEEERTEVFQAFIEKYAKNESVEAKENKLKKRAPYALIIKVAIEHITGKEALEYARNRS